VIILSILLFDSEAWVGVPQTQTHVPLGMNEPEYAENGSSNCCWLAGAFFILKKKNGPFWFFLFQEFSCGRKHVKTGWFRMEGKHYLVLPQLGRGAS